MTSIQFENALIYVFIMLCSISTRPVSILRTPLSNVNQPRGLGRSQLRQAPCRIIHCHDSVSPSEYLVDVDGFSITKISFGTILAPIGVTLMVYGFCAYFDILPGGDVSSLLLIYGFPLTLLGFALKYAELKPVICKSTPAALKLRETQMTDIQKQVREDTTRFRYGDEQHLEEALERIFRFGRAGGLPRRLAPVLTGLREETRTAEQGQMYTLVLEFESEVTEEQWNERIGKFQSFFGPGILAEIQMRENGADIALISDGSGAGKSDVEKKDVLPPLMPGLAPRKQE